MACDDNPARAGVSVGGSVSDRMIPLYDIHKTYLENAEEGPLFHATYPERILPPNREWIDFLGFQVATPIGIPAGPLLNAKWIKCASRLGFDVLTYKTMRSHEFHAHPLPNVIFVDHKEMIKEEELQVVHPAKAPPTQFNELAITNSFGNPSRDPEYLMADIARSKECLLPGQVLIVSIFGSGPHLKQDFIKAAELAISAGADIIEANFSCPNLGKGGILYHDSDLAYELTKSIKSTLKKIPLIIKVGLFPTQTCMEKVMYSFAKGGAEAVCGINTIPMKVQDQYGNPALGPDRPQAGICGAPIRKLALDFIRKASEVISKKKLTLTLLGCGGIVEPTHFNDYLDAGAEIALTATGMMWNPYLAYEWRHAKDGKHCSAAV